MYYQVAYDISSNKTRLLAVKLCKLAGLVRIQRSIFAGASDAQRIEEIKQQLLPHLRPKTDRLSIQPIDAAAWKSWATFGTRLNKEAIAREEGVVFF